MKKRVGRPKSDNPKSDTLQVRLTNIEKSAIKITAQTHGYSDVSKFMRGLLLGSPQIKHTMQELTNQ